MNEALHAKWEHVDKEHRLWRIPSANSKSKKVRAVPLNNAALDVLDQLDTGGSHEHLFINARTRQPYTTIYKVWCRIRSDTGLPLLRLHDLRHQYGAMGGAE